ncbi:MULTISPECIES: ProQ/FINO family protein [unclassified Halomonas]|uniref:ProQ/FINO family protein n=1 Tax=unclassified Halomonas TaxID=2609666 RepID=UPI0020A1B7DE|nr:MULTISPECIES: ProQ/FINO family protein [unclassified Halomonas]MCP1315180.1 ProQ/FINO family protein [Halomonas sp. 707D7]MCP1326768.1 ProQ/FINO family protein [Halomonas sp. 707D4]
MAASVLNLIESLEAHLAGTQQELEQLRRENARLKEQLAHVLERPLAATSPAEEAPAPVPEAATRGETPPSPQALLKQWYERYPEAFFKGHTKPLKVGIHIDLAQREPWSGKLIRRALANYVNLPRYVKSMREGAERVDLDGQPAGIVDKEASLHASERRKEQVGEEPAKPAFKKPGNSPVPARNEVRQQAGHDQPSRSKDEGQVVEDAKAPLTMEEKIKGLMQKFEAR